MAGIVQFHRSLWRPLSGILPGVLLLCCLASVPVRAADSRADPKIVQAVNRLTYGPGPGLLGQAEAMGLPAFIESQLNPETLAEPPGLTEALAALPSLQMDTVRLFREYGPPAEAGRDGDPEAMRRTFDRADVVALEAAKARLLRAIASPRQLQELMVDFWCEHFSLGAKKGLAHLWVGSFEREAIRPYAMGRFLDLLAATAMHPAMLIARGNWKNVVHRDGGQGAREALEPTYAALLLAHHTLGPGGPQKPADTQALARILTGWRVGAARADSDTGGFYFDVELHDPSDKTLLGQTVKGTGLGEGAAALRILAEHPATARNISRKLAVYFLTDDPPAGLVASMAETFGKTGGNIREVLRTLFTNDAFFDAKYRGGRIKSPLRHIVSSVRAMGQTPTDAAALAGALAGLGQPLFAADGPEGYLPGSASWQKPEALPRRVSFAGDLAAGRIAGLSPAAKVGVQTLTEALGPELSPAVGQAAAKAGDNGAGVILASPDFLRY
ncbi:DUF1800 domain-containing protein [Desulfovibrio sp. TomC]|uniref:DUF1800 domain-containing protein n=1 Tax=Desulfovibrio sp. TomC TaxID=1562888 RepID=UPI0005750DF8|nr:DUF1800 domain-containing protein [Desulfovibrio sp. TomC]KHK03901.1 putative SIGNAL PEPTIDE PROTEIN [Desulfovibrio sp. TomC]